MVRKKCVIKSIEGQEVEIRMPKTDFITLDDVGYYKPAEWASLYISPDIKSIFNQAQLQGAEVKPNFEHRLEGEMGFKFCFENESNLSIFLNEVIEYLSFDLD